jgi:hypothetical protein
MVNMAPQDGMPLPQTDIDLGTPSCLTYSIFPVSAFRRAEYTFATLVTFLQGPPFCPFNEFISRFSAL